MSATAHTPGPWIPYKRPEPIGYAEYEIHHGAIGECVAEVVHGESNARLLAAAPEMLDALRRAVLALAFASETSATMRDDYNVVSAAIAKATGSAQ